MRYKSSGPFPSAAASTVRLPVCKVMQCHKLRAHHVLQELHHVNDLDAQIVRHLWSGERSVMKRLLRGAAGVLADAMLVSPETHQTQGPDHCITDRCAGSLWSQDSSSAWSDPPCAAGLVRCGVSGMRSAQRSSAGCSSAMQAVAAAISAAWRRPACALWKQPR